MNKQTTESTRTSQIIRLGPRRVYVQSSGNSNSTLPPVMLLSGTLVSSRSWRRLTPLIRDRRIVAVDLVGVGQTSRARAPRDLALSAQAGLLEQLFDALHLEKVDMVGASYGGCVALVFGGLHPGRVRSVAAIEPPLLATGHDWIRQVRPGLEWLRVGRLAFWSMVKSGLLARRWTNKLLGRRLPTAPDQKRHSVFTCFYDPYARIGNWRALLFAPIDDPTRALTAIRAPILCIEGSESPLRPQMDRVRELLTRLHPSLCWNSITLAQHDAEIQLPALVADALTAFWRNLP
ncbi:MAG: alpha/beta fold hydrolase [Aggregatilineales bacterium]